MYKEYIKIIYSDIKISERVKIWNIVKTAFNKTKSPFVLTDGEGNLVNPEWRTNLSWRRTVSIF